MMKEHQLLKWLLMIQSFLPLFTLLVIRLATIQRLNLILLFFSKLFQMEWDVIPSAIHHSEIYSVSLLFLCLIMIVVSLLIYIAFNSIQRYGFIEESKPILFKSDKTENGVAFFVTYITPFILNESMEIRDILYFLAILVSLILLMRNTNLYYQNPVLTILGYKIYSFCPSQGHGDAIALTHGNLDPQKIIKYKLISDNVYIVYNKN